MFKISPVTLRRLVIFLTRVWRAFFLRVEVVGLENIPTTGPVILAPNHASNFDPFLVAMYVSADNGQILTHDAMPYAWPWSLVINALQPLVVKQSEGIGGLKTVREFLTNGGILCVFPEGGIWEKRLDDVKLGAAYLAAHTNAKIVPVALGGTYNLLHRMAYLRRPRVFIRFGKPIDPVAYLDKSSRRVPKEKLKEISTAITQNIYQLLPPEDQRRYDALQDEAYIAALDFIPAILRIPDMPPYPVLAEFFSKPNLSKPFQRRAEVAAFAQRMGRFVPAYQFHRAVMAMYDLTNNGMHGYLEERLGAEKVVQLQTELESLTHVAQQAVLADVAIRFVPLAHREEIIDVSA